MSSNRTLYDTCEYKTRLDQNSDMLDYHLNPHKFEHCEKCTVDLGLVGGTTASHIKGDMVDLENDLRGQTRHITNCPEKHYHPDHPIMTKPTDGSEAKNVDTTPVHLPTCSFYEYKPIPLPRPLQVPTCDDRYEETHGHSATHQEMALVPEEASH